MREHGMKKIKIEICMGTACYVLGAGELLDIGEHLPAHLTDRFTVEGCSCREWCQKGNLKAPFALVDGTLVGELTLEKLTGLIKEKLL